MDLSSLSSQEKQMLLQQAQAQVSQQIVQGMAATMVDKCFKKCVYTPARSLSSREQQCMAMCMDRFQDVMGEVGKAMQERQSMQ